MDIYSIIKYVVSAVIVFLILRFSPTSKLSNSQALMTTFIMLIVFIVLDVLFGGMSYYMNQSESEGFCDSCDTHKVENFKAVDDSQTPLDDSHMDYRQSISRVPQQGLGYDSERGYIGVNCSTPDNKIEAGIDKYENSYPRYQYGDFTPERRPIPPGPNIYNLTPPYDDFDMLQRGDRQDQFGECDYSHIAPGCGYMRDSLPLTGYNL